MLLSAALPDDVFVSRRMADPSRHYFKELRLQQFRGLVALARWQTFSAAATALGLTRASVWQQVRSLEQELACTLLRTRGQRVEFTAAGEKLVEIVAPLVAGFDSVKAALQSVIGEEGRQTLVIASPPTFLVHELREPIARIHAENPELQLKIIERNSPAVIELLEQGGADLAIAARPESVAPRPALEYTQIAIYPFMLICAPGHPLLEKSKVTLRDLTHHPLILPAPGAYCRQQFDAVLSRAGLLEKVNIVLESAFPVMLFEYVQLGLGVALSPLPSQPGPAWDRSDVVRRNVEHLFGVEPIYIVRRRGEFETRCAARFRELVIEAADRPALTPTASSAAAASPARARRAPRR